MQPANFREPAHPVSFNTVTDWYIPENEDQPFLVYPGPISAENEILYHAKKLREMILWRQGQVNDTLRDWRMNYRDIPFRVHRQRTVDGTMHILRRISTILPELSDLGLPVEIQKMVSASSFGEFGGLVIVSGGPGHGKSTTCAAILANRVKSFGLFCLTVEDPPEFSLHGEHVSHTGRIGKIVQVPAATESFASDLKDALRCYPSNMRGSMLMVGEVRDGDTAAQLLRSAMNGQLVFASIHASSPIAALERLLSLAKEVMGQEEANALLAHSLRAVLQQRLDNGKISMDPLLSPNEHSPVAARIKQGNLSQLSSDVQQQNIWLKNSTLLMNIKRMGAT